MKNKYIEQNPLKWEKYIAKWRAENKDKMKAYRKKNSTKLKAYYSQWIKKNREKMRTLQAEWYQKNKEKVKQNGKRYYDKNSKKINTRRKVWRTKYPERIRSLRVVENLKKQGILIKKPCKVCNDPKTEAHHKDYTKPHKVIWLCKLHHSIADKQRRAKELKNANKTHKSL